MSFIETLVESIFETICWSTSNVTFHGMCDGYRFVPDNSLLGYAMNQIKANNVERLKFKKHFGKPVEAYLKSAPNIAKEEIIEWFYQKPTWFPTYYRDSMDWKE